MKKHNYTALTTFRGWSEEEEKWVYGFYVEDFKKGYTGPSLSNKHETIIVPDAVDILIVNKDGDFIVHQDSIGVYTGKDDKDEDAIFGAIGRLGGDITVAEFLPNFDPNPKVWDKDAWSDKYQNLLLVVSYKQANFKLSVVGEPFTNWWLGSPNVKSLQVVSTQWEEHLKEQ